MNGKKKLLVNVFPKNGTHLLIKLLSLLPGYRYTGVEIDWGDPDRALATLATMKGGEIVKAHLPWREATAESIQHNGIDVCTLIRDPRDTVLSFVHYILKHHQHPLHAVYRAMPNDEVRLLNTIDGFADEQGEPVIRDIGSRLRDWQPWEEDPKVHRVKFEALIGEQGGGTRAAQADAIRTLADRLEVPLGDAAIAEMGREVFDRSVHSFREGKIGGWSGAYGEKHRRAFEDRAGWYLRAHGYTEDDRW